MTLLIVRSDTLGRLAALLLLLLIATPYTAPFSTMQGTLEMSSCPVETVKSETTSTPAVIEQMLLHLEPEWSLVVVCRAAPPRDTELARTHRILRL